MGSSMVWSLSEKLSVACVFEFIYTFLLLSCRARAGMPDRRIVADTAACQAPLRILRAQGPLIATIGRNKPSRLAQHSLIRGPPRARHVMSCHVVDRAVHGEIQRRKQRRKNEALHASSHCELNESWDACRNNVLRRLHCAK